MNDSTPQSTLPADAHRPSLLFLVLGNLVPIAGVLFLGWDLRAILYAYWLESAVVGVYNILKMLIVGGGRAIPLCLFFIVHYGIFMMVHVGLIPVITKQGSVEAGFLPADSIRAAFDANIAWIVIPLFISHGVSFVLNFLARERETVAVNDLMSQPYHRIMIMHLTVLAAAFLISFVGVSSGLLIALVGVKLFVDIASHLRERRRARRATA